CHELYHRVYSCAFLKVLLKTLPSVVYDRRDVRPKRNAGDQVIVRPLVLTNNCRRCQRRIASGFSELLCDVCSNCCPSRTPSQNINTLTITRGVKIRPL